MIFDVGWLLVGSVWALGCSCRGLWPCCCCLGSWWIPCAGSWSWVSLVVCLRCVGAAFERWVSTPTLWAGVLVLAIEEVVAELAGVVVVNAVPQRYGSGRVVWCCALKVALSVCLTTKPILVASRHGIEHQVVSNG